MKYSRTFGLVASMLLASSISVYAADPIVNDVAVPVSSWTGFYLGGGLGYGKNSDDFEHLNVNNFGGPGGTYSNDGNGFVGGVFGGYNYQFSNNVVLGAELGFRSGSNGDDGGEFAKYNNTTSTDIKWVGTAEAKLGYAFDQWMPYVTAGYAGGRVEMGQDYHPPMLVPTTFNDSAFLSGYTVGAGVDYKVTERIIVGVKYNFTDLGGHDFSGRDSSGTLTQIHGDFKEHTVMARLSYQF